MDCPVVVATVDGVLASYREWYGPWVPDHDVVEVGVVLSVRSCPCPAWSADARLHFRSYCPFLELSIHAFQARGISFSFALPRRVEVACDHQKLCILRAQSAHDCFQRSQDFVLLLDAISRELVYVHDVPHLPVRCDPDNLNPSFAEVSQFLPQPTCPEWSGFSTGSEVFVHQHCDPRPVFAASPCLRAPCPGEFALCHKRVVSQRTLD
eukprot:3933422-Rhodomonas_salina.4